MTPLDRHITVAPVEGGGATAPVQNALYGRNCFPDQEGGGSRRGARDSASELVRFQEPCLGSESRIRRALEGIESFPSCQLPPTHSGELERNPNTVESPLSNQHTDAPAKSSKAIPQGEDQLTDRPRTTAETVSCTCHTISRTAIPAQLTALPLTGSRSNSLLLSQ